jgi:hypothetical protein
MKMPYWIVFLSFTFGLSAQTPPKFERFKIDIDAPRSSFFDAIEHIEIIRLEETGSSLLSSMNGYFKIPSGIAIPNKGENPPYTIVLFDETGNYKNVIDRNGPGPEEYSNISSVWFNKGKIEIFSGASRNLQRYTVEGKYIETINAGYDKSIFGASMIPHQNGYLFHQVNPSSPIKTIAYDGLFFLDEKLNVTGTGVAINSPNRTPINFGKQLSQHKGSAYYKKDLNDTVFQVLGDKVFPRFKFDFGDNWAWSDPKSNATLKNAFRTALSSEGAVEVVPEIGTNLIALTYYVSLKNEEKGFVNRESGKFTRFDMRKENKEKYELRFIQWEGDNLVSSIAAYDFKEFMQNLKKDQFTVAGGVDLEEIFQSENPVLLKIKFKDR